MQGLLRNISHRELRLLMLGIGAVLTVLNTFASVVPKLKVYRATTATISTLENTSLDTDELERQLQGRHKAIDEIQYRLNGDLGELPEKQIEAFIVGRLQRASWNNGVELVSVEPATGDRVQIFQEILFNVVLIGEYENLYRWLWETRNELGYVVIKEYRITRNDDADDNPRLLANVSLASYRVAQ